MSLDVCGLQLVLTADCNLRCSYCYQNRKTCARIDRDTIVAAVDLLSRSSCRELGCVLIGGEPLLEFDLFRFAVGRLEALRRGGKQVTLSTATNGMLLDAAKRAFLAAHNIDTTLSFDGVPEAQELRARGTFRTLDGLLDCLRKEDPGFHRDRLTVGITLTGANLPWLADSVRYFLDKGISRITIDPLITAERRAGPVDINAVDAQFERIFRMCVRHYKDTGEEPFVPLCKVRRLQVRPGDRIEMCGSACGENPAVDVDGQVYGCTAFANSYQAFPPGLLQERLGALHLGHIRDLALPERLRRYPEALERAEMFDDKQDKYSSFGRCGDCACLGECMVCPLSIGHLPGNRDPRRIPDLPCAVNRVAAKYRARFPRRAAPIGWITGRRQPPRAVREILARAGPAGPS